MEAGIQLTNPTEDNCYMAYPYKEMIGSLIYAATATQPNIVFVTSTLTQFTQSTGLLGGGKVSGQVLEDHLQPQAHIQWW